MKTAGSSVELSLIKYCGEEDILTGDSLHSDISEFQSRNNTFNFHTHSLPHMVKEKVEVDDHYKFSMVRNPWDVVVSYYWFAFTKSGKYKLSKNFDDIRNHFTKWLSCKSLYNWPRCDELPLSKKEVFDCLVDLSVRDSQYTREQILDSIRRGTFSFKIPGISSHYASSKNKFWQKTAVEHISHVNEGFYDDDLDYTIRYEKLQEDYENVCNKINIPCEILPRIKSEYKKADMPYVEYYNDDTKKMVEELI
jgi:hypothetical protein